MLGLIEMILRLGMRFGALKFALLTVAMLLPQSVWACPSCAVREDGGIAANFILAAMMLLPFGLVAVVIYVLRKAAIAENTQVPVTDLDPAGGEQRP